MSVFCHYHPTKPAHWACAGCNLTLCPDCVTRRNRGELLTDQSIYLCPKCGQEVDWLGAAHLIEPFWNRLPRFFTYPFSAQPLILITILSIVSLIFSGKGLFSGLTHLVLWAVLIKYSYEALKATARGDLTPPAINAQTISDDFHQVFKQLGLFFIIGVAVAGTAAKIGVVIGLLVLIFAMLSVPAMIILLATTNSLLHALNPMLFIRLAMRIGWGYLLMYFFLMLLGGAPAALAPFIVKLMPAGLHRFLFAFAQNFYTIISYHLMGYVILQYHEQIGYQVDRKNFEDASRPTENGPESEAARLLKEVNILIQEGKLDEAITLIQHATSQTGIDDLILSERYFGLLKMKKRKSGLLDHCVTHLKLLIEDGQKAKAYRLYLQCQALDSNFTPRAPTLFQLGGWLNETGKSKASITAFNRLTKAHPRHQLVPKAYFRAAQVFHDRLMNPRQAKKILNALIKKYPDHEIIGQVKTYLGHL